MSSFTIVNLKELDDDTGGRAPGISGSFARKYLDSEHLGVSIFRYGPGVRASMAHHHKTQEEAYIVVAGSGRLRLGDEVRDIREWDVIRVSPETIRAFEAGDDGLEIVAVGSDRPEGGDGVAVPNDWPES